MKVIRIALIALLAAGSLADFSSAQPPVRALPQPVLASVGVSVGVHTAGLDLFYTNLAPYGQWVNRASYGWVWAPRRVSTRWRPYTRGHWVYTDYGWTWVSSEPWAWATYHYGRWTFDPDYGWTWVPGTEWGPSWVDFHEGGGYLGWAPLPPEAAFDSATGLSAGFDLSVGIAPTYYSFCRERDFLAADASQVIVPWDRNVEIIRQTRDATRFAVVNNEVINQSLPPQHIEQVIGRPVPRFPVVPAASPAQVGLRGNQVAVFKPAIVNRNVAPPPQVIRQSARFARTQPPTVAQRAAVLAAAGGAAAIAARQAHQAHQVTAQPGRPGQQQALTRAQQRQAAQATRAQAAPATRAQQRQAAAQRNLNPGQPAGQRNGLAATARQQRLQQRQAAAQGNPRQPAGPRNSLAAGPRNGQRQTGLSANPRQQRRSATQPSSRPPGQPGASRNLRQPAGARNPATNPQRQGRAGAPGSFQRQVAAPRQYGAPRSSQPQMRQQPNRPPARFQARQQQAPAAPRYPARQQAAPPQPRYQARQQAPPPRNFTRQQPPPQPRFQARQQPPPPPRAQARQQPAPPPARVQRQAPPPQPRAQAQPRPQPQPNRRRPPNSPPPPNNG